MASKLIRDDDAQSTARRYGKLGEKKELEKYKEKQLATKSKKATTKVATKTNDEGVTNKECPMVQNNRRLKSREKVS